MLFIVAIGKLYASQKTRLEMLQNACQISGFCKFWKLFGQNCAEKNRALFHFDASRMLFAIIAEHHIGLHDDRLDELAVKALYST